MNTITELILDYVEAINQKDVPIEIKEFIDESLIDYLGNTYAGVYGAQKKVNAYVELVASQNEGVYPIGGSCKMAVTDAALINGMNAHFYDLDDGSRYGMVHVGSVLFSCLFAMSQKRRMLVDDFYKAVLVGYEVTLRFACSVQPNHKKAGFHATGTCGCIGAALALATAYKCNRSEMGRVLATATASASGLLEMISDTSELKPFNIGHAAANAITAYEIGIAGFEGPRDPIGGKRGFVENMGKKFDDTYWRRTEYNKYMITSIYRKSYASCRHCHPSVEAALKLRHSEVEEYSFIEKIIIETYNLAIQGHNHVEITGSGSAKMSIPYSVAAAFVLGDGGIKAVSDEAVNDERILSLTKKVEIIEKQEYSKLAPNMRISCVNVHLKDGTIEQCKVTFPKGEPENPMTRENILSKFQQLTSYSKMSEIQQCKILDCISNLTDCFDELIDIICGGVSI